MISRAGLARLVLLVAALGSALQANAETLTVDGWAFRHSSEVDIQLKKPAIKEDVLAGAFLAEVADSSFLAFCVDIFQETKFDRAISDYSLMSATSLFGAAKATDLGRLATGFYTKVVDAATAGAFQIAVWEIVNEKNGNAYNLRGGSFKAFADSKQVQALAQDWLNNLPQANTYSLDIWHSPSHQDLAVFSALGEVMSPVPEPATVALVLAGLSLLGMARREEPKGIHKRG